MADTEEMKSAFIDLGRTVLLSLCVLDRIQHPETVTGVTVSRLGGLHPWAAHGADFLAPAPPLARTMLLDLSSDRVKELDQGPPHRLVVDHLTDGRGRG